MKEDILLVYKYFSHHMRNSTAMIAASVTLLSYQMDTNDEELLSEVVEASFLLDLFDAAMNICFKHLLGEHGTVTEDDFSLEATVAHFSEQMKTMLDEKNIVLTLSIEHPAVVKARAYDLKTITSIIIYEVILQAEKHLKITLKENILEIYTESFYEAPQIWKILKRVLAERRVEFNYIDNNCTLRFL
jgi:hypothetical protein